MPPLKTAKFRAALAHLEKLGLQPSMIEGMSRVDGKRIYAELKQRGLIWSSDLEKWRPNKKPKARKLAKHYSGYLDHVQVRLITRMVTVNEALEELTAAMRERGYEVDRVSVHNGRNDGEALVYLTVYQMDDSHA